MEVHCVHVPWHLFIFSPLHLLADHRRAPLLALLIVACVLAATFPLVDPSHCRFIAVAVLWGIPGCAIFFYFISPDLPFPRVTLVGKGNLEHLEWQPECAEAC